MKINNDLINKSRRYFLPASVLLIVITTIILSSVFLYHKKGEAEQSGGTPESGATSRIKTIYDSLVALSHGSDAAGGWGDWGAYWNRIRSAAEWVPTGNSAVTDVKSGKTFFNTTRSAATGTYPNPTGCSTQQYMDNNASATSANNCSLTWTVASPPVTGDDGGTGNKDPRTDLVWSQYLKNNAGTVEFAASGGSTWSWNSTGDADNVAVGNKTAIQLCSERGDGWRLPSQKDNFQAYIDGVYWNLSQSNVDYWSRTEQSAGNAYFTSFGTGYTIHLGVANSASVRCVR